MMENPSGLQPREILEKIQADELPREFLALVARGFLPIEQEDLIAMLAVLSTRDDAEIAASARQSLDEIPRSGMLAFARDEGSPAAGLDALLLHSDDAEILGALVRNRSATNGAVVGLAKKAPPKLQEVIVTNQRRIIEDPTILDALLENPELTSDVRRRVHEAREEFFDKAASREARRAEQAAAEEAEALSAEEAEALSDLLEKAAESDEEEEEKPVVPEDVPEEEKSIWVRILNMPVSDRVKLAFRGGRTERSILIKDRNKLVCSAVIRSPRLTETEVESFATMRNIEGDVLRQIGVHREWTRKYPIVLSLVRNPKAPIGVVLPLINRLNLRDLKNLSQDRGVPEAVRSSARRLFVNRSKH